MKVLFYSSGGLTHAVISVLLDDAIILSKQGHDVYFVYNDCSFEICTHNLNHSSVMCEICHRRMIKSLELLPSSIHKINIKKYWVESKDQYFAYNSISDIKKIKYKGVQVGYAVLSSYISTTRNLNPIISKETKWFWDKMIATSCHVTDALENAIDAIHPDRVCFFNARAFEWRPPYDLAIQKGIEAISYERTNDVGGNNCIVRFVNSTPHDIKRVQEKCRKLWENAALSEKEKQEIGKSFFQKRRAGIATNDKVYIGGQEKGKLPSDWDDSKRNFVIFNSSEDEYVAIGEEYDSKSLFPSQIQGIRYILESLKKEKNIHVYLRIHPNLAKVPYRYHTELQKFEDEYDNVTVIPAANAISSYDLMDAAEKIIVFGSTMGIEATYWDKPVILLAGALYYYSGFCYIPQKSEELSKMLIAHLVPKDNMETIKWGFYFMYRNPDDKYKHIDIDSHWFNVGKHKWFDIHYLKLFGSSKLYAIYTKLLVRYYRRHAKSFEIPRDEDKDAIL